MAVEERWLIYPNKVESGEIKSCKWQKLAVQRFRRFLARDDMYFDPSIPERVIRFFSKFKHYEGATAGQRFILSEYQEFIIYCIYGFRWKDSGLRVCRQCWLETSRKSGKSFFSACICLFEFIAAGEPAAQIVIAANSREQAKLIFKMCSTLCRQVDPKGKIFHVLRNSIELKALNSELKVISADAGLQDGMNVSMSLIDEVHEAKDDKLYSVIQSSMAMRKQPLIMMCTTAGFNLNGFGHQMHDNACQILDGIVEDVTTQAFIFTIDPEDNWEDPECWQKSNPNLGQTVSVEFLQDQVNKAKTNPVLRSGILTKSFNLWLSVSDCFIPDEYICNAMDEGLRLEDFKDYNAYASADLSAVNDITSLSVMVPLDGKFYFWTWYFLPEDTIETSVNREKYKYWRQTGQLIVTQGNVQDLNALFAKLKEVNDIVVLQKFGYDQWGSTSLSIQMSDEGFGDLLQPVSQSIGNFSRGHKMLQTILMNGTCKMEKNDITRWMFSNVHIREDHNSNQKGEKGKDRSAKIDGYISMTQCLLLYLDDPRYTYTVTV